MAIKKNQNINRVLLTEVLTQQYSQVKTNEKVNANIQLLAQDNTFTICTAHQPNIFTGHLYFIYKILHACKLAEELKAEMKEANFVPVYYMGSEDADLDELGEVVVNGEKYKWETAQQGAVGRMKVDAALLNIIDRMEGQLGVEPFGQEAMSKLRNAYQPGRTIEQATFHLVHELFADYGLLVLLPDHADLKKIFIPVAQRELTAHFSHQAVAETIDAFPQAYKIQVKGRDINLFYLKDDIRARIEKQGDDFVVHGTAMRFSEQEMMEELHAHPERFSPNVILRPVFQEMILPNVAFIGGGGELAYWLELKRVFEKSAVPFPVLLLRNSFSLLEDTVLSKMNKLGLAAEVFFQSEENIVRYWLTKNEKLHADLREEKTQLSQVYQQIKNRTSDIDVTLEKHTGALLHKALYRLDQLEKKMEKALVKKHEAEVRQIEKIKRRLYPDGILQERIDNYFTYHARWGEALMEQLYLHSKGMQQQFCCISLQP